MVEVRILPEAAEQLEELANPIHARMLNLIERLQRWPEVSGAKPLTGKLAGRYRLRTGDYRLQFRVEAGRVIIEKIAHRDRFYGE